MRVGPTTLRCVLDQIFRFLFDWNGSIQFPVCIPERVQATFFRTMATPSLWGTAAACSVTAGLIGYVSNLERGPHAASPDSDCPAVRRRWINSPDHRKPCPVRARGRSRSI